VVFEDYAARKQAANVWGLLALKIIRAGKLVREKIA